jgi:hypothetical protein
VAVKGDAARRRAGALGACLVLEGGPHNGAWYTVKNFEEMVAAEARMIPYEDREAVLVHYVPTDRLASNPDRNYEGLVGKVYRFRTFRERQQIKAAAAAKEGTP